MQDLPVLAGSDAQVPARTGSHTHNPVRFRFIDALRGIAALMVLVFHIWFNTAFGTAAALHLPPWLGEFVFTAHTGVDIFFVISGFVIAHSIRGLRISARTAANFALRRQVRLDPPYWVCILCMLGVGYLTTFRAPDVARMVPLGDVALNFLYLQGIFHAHPIVEVSWTLCLEVQFYIVLILLAWFAQRFDRPRAVQLVLVVIVTLLSFGWQRFGPRTLWFIQYWYMFGLGVIAYAAYVHRSLWWGAVTLAAAALTASTWWPLLWSRIAPATALMLLMVGRAGHLSDWLSGPVFQYFGRISYSLYLVHFKLVSVVAHWGLDWAHDSLRAAVAVGLVAAALAIGAAHLLHKYVEAPSARLAWRLKPGRKRRVEPIDETPGYLGQAVEASP